MPPQGLTSSSAVGCTGAVLVLAGTAWSCWCVVAAYPQLLVIAVGCACLIFAAIAAPEGLLVRLPQGLQDLLVRGAHLRGG